MSEKTLKIVKSRSHGNSGSWEWDVQENCVTATEDALRIFGLEYRNDGYSMNQILEIIHQDDRTHIQEKIAEITLGRIREATIEYRIVHTNNSVGVARTWGKGRYNEEGMLTHLYGVTEDITRK